MNCAPKPKINRNAGSSGSSTYRVCIDPSGIMYEAVLSNPVDSATMALYTADGNYVPQYQKNDAGLEVYVDENGKPKEPQNQYNSNGNLTVPDVNNLDPKELTMATGPDGRYQWMVPAGLWYVEVQKEGYQPGSSNNDMAAVISLEVTTGCPCCPLSWTSTSRWSAMIFLRWRLDTAPTACTRPSPSTWTKPR